MRDDKRITRDYQISRLTGIRLRSHSLDSSSERADLKGLTDGCFAEDTLSRGTLTLGWMGRVEDSRAKSTTSLGGFISGAR